MSSKPILQGLIVVDLTTNISGPYTTYILSSLGAEVWKVERPIGGDDARGMSPVVGGTSAYFSVINASKKSIVVDLGTRRGREVLGRLLERADILVDNFRPPTTEKLGLSWGKVRRRNPHIVYSSISGFGDAGPDRDRTGFDAVLQARTGIVSVTGNPGSPPIRVGVSILDLTSGIWAALGILAALRERDRTGRGQRVSTSLFETGVFFLGYHLASYQLTGNVPGPQGSSHGAFSPYGAFTTSDGHILIGISSDRQFQRLARALGRQDWLSDPRYRSNVQRVANREELKKEMEKVLSHREAKYWEDCLLDAEVPATKIQHVDEVLADRQAEALSLFRSVDLGEKALKIPRIPLSFRGRGGKEGAARLPRLGQHTREILRRAGYPARETDALLKGRVVLD